MTDPDTVNIPTKRARTRRLKVAYNNSQVNPGHKVAAIRFSGTYLEDLGFNVGDYFDMIINNDHSLTLRPVTADQHKQEQEAKSNVTKTNE